MLKENLALQKERLNRYKVRRESIHKVVHSFDEKDQLVKAEQLEQQLQHSFTQMRQIDQSEGIDIALKKGEKILRQIPDIAKGVTYWVQWLNKQMEQFNANEQEKVLLEILLPYAYWQVHQNKKTTKKKEQGTQPILQKKSAGCKTSF